MAKIIRRNPRLKLEQIGHWRLGLRSTQKPLKNPFLLGTFGQQKGETMEIPWKNFHCFYVDAKKNRCFHLTAHEATKTAMDSSLAKPSHTSGLDFHHLPPPTRLVIDKSPLVSTKCHARSVSVVQSITSFFCGAVWGVFPCLPLSKLFDASEKSSHGNHHFYTCDLFFSPGTPG